MSWSRRESALPSTKKTSLPAASRMVKSLLMENNFFFIWYRIVSAFGGLYACRSMVAEGVEFMQRPTSNVQHLTNGRPLHVHAGLRGVAELFFGEFVEKLADVGFGVFEARRLELVME